MATTSDINYWLDEDCARAFWDQQYATPYQDLLQDTVSWLDPEPGESWLDLGCGSGQLSAALWRKSGGTLARIVAQDCNPVNARQINKLQRKLVPSPGADQLAFVIGDFSAGLPQYEDESFDGIVSGLAICYAESRDPVTGRYTDTAYNLLLDELFRVLRPGRRLVFSVTAPRPRFWRLFWRSLRMAFRSRKPVRLFLNAMKMERHGGWLKREARRGRFHFLPSLEIIRRLSNVGFTNIRCQPSLAGQAFLFAAQKPE